MTQMNAHVLPLSRPMLPSYTGRPPVHGVCPGVDADGRMHALPQVRLDASRQELLDYFDNGWTLTELLFSGLASEEAFYRRPYHQLRHPMIFYYGHPVSLYVNKLRVAGLLDGPVDAALETLFETGVDEMRWDDLHDGADHSWPTIEAVRAYRANVYHVIRTLIETHPLLDAQHLPITQASPMWALVMAFEHERIHLETSSVLMRELPIEDLQIPAAWPTLGAAGDALPIRMLAMEATTVEVGKPADVPTFGWDNEYGAETRHVRPFSASSTLVTNAAFLEFVRAGGYANEHYWSREGWGWKRFRNVKAPTFWVSQGPAGLHEYRLRTVFEIIDMPMNWPAIVNFHEAKAYCAWKSEQEQSAMPYRLLTESEHHALRDGRAHPANLALATGAECSVTAFAANEKGFYDLFGNAWNWCEDHFHPLKGGAPHPYYDDFSAPCYDGEHQMILGGSFVSAGDEAGPYARFHFRPHFFQHAGFRIARSEDGNPASDAKLLHRNGAVTYETAEMLNKYLLMHFGTDEQIYDESVMGAAVPPVVNLPVTCAALIREYATGHESALDIGCAVGRSTFELARDFASVTGIDYSGEFVAAGSTLKRSGQLSYLRKDSGAQSTKLMACVDETIDRSRVRFEQGDACALPLNLKSFDAVLLANVLCRLPEPIACLERMQGTNALVKPGGILVMTTPLSWLEEYTKPAQWLNGLDDVARVLSEFELLHQAELPFMIREHRRKFEYIITQASVWRRKA